MKFIYHGLAACSLLLNACSNSDSDRGEIHVNFDHVIAGAELVPSEIRYTNAAGNEYAITRLEYIVSDIILETTAGKRVDLTEVHYRNALSNATRSLSAHIPGGEYSVLHFTFGIDGGKNETGALPSLEHFNNMAWPSPMGGGYHYMRMEGLFRIPDGEGSFLTHTGPSAGADFSFDVSLPLHLSVNGGSWGITVVMDINQWYDAPTVYDFNDRGSIMGNADAQFTLQENGTAAFSISHAGRHDHDAHEHEGEENHEETAGEEQNHEEHADD